MMSSFDDDDSFDGATGPGTSGSFASIEHRAEESRKRLIKVGVAIVVVLAVLALGIVFVLANRDSDSDGGSGDGSGSSDGGAAGSAAGGATGGAGGDPMEQINDLDYIVDGLYRITGLFTLYQTTPLEPALLMELRESQFERPFLTSIEFSSADDEFALLHLSATDAAYALNVLEWRLSPDGMHVHLYPSFDVRVPDDSPDAAAFGSVTDTVELVASFPVEAAFRRDLAPCRLTAAGCAREESAYLIEVGSFINSGMAGLSPPAADGDGTVAVRMQSDGIGYPENVELDYLAVVGQEEGASVLLGVHISFRSLPTVPLEPRVRDDRIGYFSTDYSDPSQRRLSDVSQRIIHRWRLEHNVATNETVKPIIYHVDPSWPERFRQAVKRGVEMWLPAFEAAGFRNAIHARLPGDPDWPADYDASDTRYSSITFTPYLPSTFAIGPSHVDPRTGEILDADIVFTAGWEWYYQNDYKLYHDGDVPPSGRFPVRQPARSELATKFPQAMRKMRHRQKPAVGSVVRCASTGLQFRVAPQPWHADGAGTELTTEHLLSRDPEVRQRAEELDRRTRHTRTSLLMAARGAAELPMELVLDGISDVIVHEVGHTLGLRHNFRGSAYTSDGDWVAEHGLTSSVMDYLPLNFHSSQLAGSPEGNYYHFTPVLGAYDMWAIEYGYRDVSDSDELRAIAERDQFRLDHQYATDEMARSDNRDPYAVLFDLGANPLDHIEDLLALMRELWLTVEERFMENGDGWWELGSATSSMIRAASRSTGQATTFVGGQRVVRAHYGAVGYECPAADPSVELCGDPVQPVDPVDVRRALTLVTDLLTGDDLLPPVSMWPKMVRYTPADNDLYLVRDVHDSVLSARLSLIERLLDPNRILRVRDNAWLQTAQGVDSPVHVREVFWTLHEAVLADLMNHTNADLSAPDNSNGNAFAGRPGNCADTSGGDAAGPGRSFQLDIQGAWVEFVLERWADFEPEAQSVVTSMMHQLRDRIESVWGNTAADGVWCSELTEQQRAHWSNMHHKITVWMETGTVPVPARAANTVICTELHRQGLFDAATMEADREMGARLGSTEPGTMEAYRMMARPWVRWMRGSEHVTRATYWLAEPWSRHMRYAVGRSGDDSTVGRLVMQTGLALCRTVAWWHGL